MNKLQLWTVSSGVVVLLCMLSYAFADIRAAVWFHQLKNTEYYNFFNVITLFGEPQWYLVAGLFLFIVYHNKRPFRASRGLFLFSSVALSGITADIIKFIAGRTRPSLYFSSGLYLFDFFHFETEWTSFPSGHSATALSAAIALATLYPRWRFILIFAGIMIAFSRLVLARHYISDVIAGSFLGIVSVVLLYNLYFKATVNAAESPEI
jgi:membrane-associated phospholipid phosphatase